MCVFMYVAQAKAYVTSYASQHAYPSERECVGFFDFLLSQALVMHEMYHHRHLCSLLVPNSYWFGNTASPLDFLCHCWVVPFSVDQSVPY